MKFRPVGAELFHADGQTVTDVTELIVAFRNSANARKNDDLQKFRRLNFSYEDYLYLNYKMLCLEVDGAP